MKINDQIDWNGRWKRMVGSNYQALATYRITLGFLLFCELALRFRFLKPFYSDQGTLPNHILLPQIDSLYRLVCVHAYNGSLLYQQVLLTVQCLFALSLMVGFKTTISSIISWFLYLSLTLKNTWLNFILDRYFHYLLFYAMFLPLDRAWSIDERSRKKKKNYSDNSSSTIVSLATFAFKAQVLWIYLDAGSGKYMDPLGGWTLNADPLPALDTYARHTIVARYMYSLLGPTGLRLLTPTVVYVEMFCVPITLLASFVGSQSVVYAMIGTICSLHIGISMTIRNTVLLSSVACCSWCPFLPPLTKVSDKQMDEPKPNSSDGKEMKDSQSATKKRSRLALIIIPTFICGSLWFETMSEECNQSMKHIWSVLLHNRWNVFVGAEEYVTWEIAPGRLADGSVVDVWGRKNHVDWDMPGTGAPCTSTARPGRWRSYPYLAEIEGEAGEILWNYLCKQWDEENNVSESRNQGRKLLRYNFFMLQADVLANMGFSATRKRLIHSHDCNSTKTIYSQDDMTSNNPEL